MQQGQVGQLFSQSCRERRDVIGALAEQQQFAVLFPAGKNLRRNPFGA